MIQDHDLLLNDWGVNVWKYGALYRSLGLEYNRGIASITIDSERNIPLIGLIVAIHQWICDVDTKA